MIDIVIQGDTMKMNAQNLASLFLNDDETTENPTFSSTKYRLTPPPFPLDPIPDSAEHPSNTHNSTTTIVCVEVIRSTLHHRNPPLVTEQDVNLVELIVAFCGNPLPIRIERHPPFPFSAADD